MRVTTLAELGRAAAESAAPAILIIGENVKLRAGLDWLGALAGKTLEPELYDDEVLRPAAQVLTST